MMRSIPVTSSPNITHGTHGALTLTSRGIGGVYRPVVVVAFGVARPLPRAAERALFCRRAVFDFATSEA